jgi:hypothetical protein
MLARHLVAALSFTLSVAAAGEPPTFDHYRVQELPSPALSNPECLPGHSTQELARGINDFGVVAADSFCFAAGQFDVPVVHTWPRAFVWSAWAGGPFTIPRPSEAQGLGAWSINNRGTVFGIEYLSGDADGFKWSPFGAYETTFSDPPECSQKTTQGAAGNLRGYLVGVGLRQGPGQSFCGTSTWLIRKPSGEEYQGPTAGQPYDLNELNYAVGDAGNSAVKVNVASGQVQVLTAGDATHFARGVDINDLNEVAGWMAAGSEFCGPSVGLRWDRNNVSRTLAHLPGRPSSRALGVGYRGETVGQSGPGRYCEQPYDDAERAVIWKANKVADLTTLIAASSGVTLMRATGVNRLGQIAAFGYRNDEPLAACPSAVFNDDGTVTMDYSRNCRNIRSYLLTPR